MSRRVVLAAATAVAAVMLVAGQAAGAPWKPDGGAVFKFIQQKTLAQADAPNLVEPRPVNRFLALQLKGIRAVNDACIGYSRYASVPEPPQYDLARSSAYASAVLLDLQSVDFGRKFTDSALSLNDRHRRHVPSSDVRKAMQTLEQNYYAYQQRLAYTQLLVQQGVIGPADVRSRMDAAFLGLASAEMLDTDQSLASWSQQHCGPASEGPSNPAQSGDNGS